MPPPCELPAVSPALPTHSEVVVPSGLGQESACPLPVWVIGLPPDSCHLRADRGFGRCLCWSAACA